MDVENVEIGTETAQFPFWEYFFQFSGTVSLHAREVKKRLRRLSICP
jgi:hypothetical protein